MLIFLIAARKEGFLVDTQSPGSGWDLRRRDVWSTMFLCRYKIAVAKGLGIESR